MKHLHAQLDAVESAMPLAVSGRVQGISGLTIEAADLPLPMGSTCKITSHAGRTCLAEVIGFQSERTLLMPLGALGGVSRGDAIDSVSTAQRVCCSPALLGRVLDGFGRPIDGKGGLPSGAFRRIDS